MGSGARDHGSSGTMRRGSMLRIGLELRSSLSSPLRCTTGLALSAARLVYGRVSVPPSALFATSNTKTILSFRTTARIDGSAASVSKMVDYALVLVPEYSDHKAITARLRKDGLLSINHTTAEYVRFKPITAS